MQISIRKRGAIDNHVIIKGRNCNINCKIYIFIRKDKIMNAKTDKEAVEFIKLLKKLNQVQQAGLNCMIDGIKLMNEQNKKRL